MNKDAGVVAIDPSTGAILADYSNPTFDPNTLANPDIAAERVAGYAYFNQSDSEGVYPGVPLATADPYPPGSTFKVVTTTAVYNLDPTLTNFVFPPAGSTKLPNSNLLLTNDGGEVCGGTMVTMLPSHATQVTDFSVLLWVRRFCRSKRSCLVTHETPRRSAKRLGCHADLPFCSVGFSSKRGLPGVLRHRAVQREGHCPLERTRGGRYRKWRCRHEALPGPADYEQRGSFGVDDKARSLDDRVDAAGCRQCYDAHEVGGYEWNCRRGWVFSVTRRCGEDRHRSDR